MKTIPIYQVDAFASAPFSGNPAAVCLLERAVDANWMQRVAAEMNLSETAFVVRRGDRGFDLRWFTPLAEVDLCGHATLATAHVLWETAWLAPGARAEFLTKSGWLTADRRDDWIVLDFPATPVEPADGPTGLTAALGVEARAVCRSRFDYLIEVADEDAVRSLAPDFAAIRALPVRGVIVTSRASDPDVDFVSRFFAPAVGIDEDPVTGSAHCALGPYWSRLLGKTDLVARQLSARGGYLRVGVHNDRVTLDGQAITIIRGELVT